MRRPCPASSSPHRSPRANPARRRVLRRQPPELLPPVGGCSDGRRPPDHSPFEECLTDLLIFKEQILRLSPHNADVGVRTRTEMDGIERADMLLAPYLPRLVQAWSSEPGAARVKTIDG